MTPQETSLDVRVLVLTPTGVDASVAVELLTEAGNRPIACSTIPTLIYELRRGVGCVLVAEEALVGSDTFDLTAALANQPPWSDVPLIILTTSGDVEDRSPQIAELFASVGNIALLERPCRTSTLLSAVHVALRARRKQHDVRDLLERERAARAEVERVARLKDEFLATLSHELRTPLSAIFGWVQLLKRGMDKPDLVREGIAVIDRNVRVQTQLIEDLLDMSRIISGKVRLDMQRVDPVAVIDAALEVVQPAADAKGVQLSKVVATKVDAVTADAGRLQQILWNLLANAVKFTPRGGRVEVVLRKTGSETEISVVDSGEGIRPEFLPHIFERFRQADGSTTRRHGGLGLGLAIVKSLVELHGGTISARSDGEGKGSTFTLALPMRDGDKETVRRDGRLEVDLDKRASALDLSGIRVLVVDDEPDARDLIQRILVGSDAVVRVAESTDDALAAILDFQPDVIVSDIGMPGRDGYDLIRSLRAAGNMTPAAALTAFARPQDRIRSIQAGYQTHLPKPVEPVELLAVIASLVGRFETEKERARNGR